ncbi:GSCOCG00009055001-RA-CDS, partial [Cotesia congregata]
PPPIQAAPIANLLAFLRLVFLDSFKRCLIAGAGPIPMILGSTPTVVYPYKRARGFRLCFLIASSLARIRAPAPSQIP